jgi:hypothetical protein
VPMTDVSRRYDQLPNVPPVGTSGEPAKHGLPARPLMPQPARFISSAPSGPYQLSSFHSGSTWEGQRAVALLALEGDKRQLEAAVDELNDAQLQSQQQQQRRSEQLQQQLHQMEASHRQALLEQSLKHQKDLQQAAVSPFMQGI